MASLGKLTIFFLVLVGVSVYSLDLGVLIGNDLFVGESSLPTVAFCLLRNPPVSTGNVRPSVVHPGL